MIDNILIHWQIGHYYLIIRKRYKLKDYPFIGRVYNIGEENGEEVIRIVYHGSHFIGINPTILRTVGLWVLTNYSEKNKLNQYYSKKDAQQRTFILLTQAIDETIKPKMSYWPYQYTILDIVNALPQIGKEIITAMIYYLKLTKKEIKQIYDSYLELF